MNSIATESAVFSHLNAPEINLKQMNLSENHKEPDGEANIFRMRQILSINRSKYEEIFREHYDGLFRYCNTMISEKEEVEDIIQNVFVELWQQRDKLQIHTSLKAFLYKSVYFKCMNAIKRNKVVNKYQQQINFTDFTQENDPVLLEEVGEKIKIATESLPEQCRKIFLLSREDGLKYNEIAQTLNLSPKTIENQMGKALRTMRNALAEYLNIIILTILSVLS
jgi:RNA polymerase sigma-70 factor (ECF subfamily)